MRKKALNIAELLIIGLVIFGIYGFYDSRNSVPRFSTPNAPIRIIFDLIIVGTLLFRAIQIIWRFRKKYTELGELKMIEKVAYATCFISLTPDLSTWYQWNYFVGLYLHFFTIFLTPLLLWTIGIVERISTKSNKIRNYGITIMSVVILVIGYTIYLGMQNQ